MRKRGVPRRIDANQPEIVAALEQAGCLVLDMSSVGGGVPDLLVCDPERKLYLLEVKNPAAKGKLNKLQEQFHQDWAQAKPAVVTSVAEALSAVGLGARDGGM